VSGGPNSWRLASRREASVPSSEHHALESHRSPSTASGRSISRRSALEKIVPAVSAEDHTIQSPTPRFPSPASGNPNSRRTASISDAEHHILEAQRLHDENKRLAAQAKSLERNYEEVKSRNERILSSKQELEKVNEKLAATLEMLQQVQSDREESKKWKAQIIAELRGQQQQYVVQVQDLKQRSCALEATNSQNSSLIEDLRLQVSALSDQLASQKNGCEQNLKPAIPLSQSHFEQSHVLPMKHSQGDEPLTPSSVVMSVNPTSRAESEKLDTEKSGAERPEPDLQAQLFQTQMYLLERDQIIVQLEREIEEVKTGKRMRASRIAHTHLTDGAPISVREALKSVVPAALPRKSRKQTFGKVTAHRSPTLHTNIHLEPIRWLARKQSREGSRPSLNNDRPMRSTLHRETQPAQSALTKGSARDADSSSAEGYSEPEQAKDDSYEGSCEDRAAQSDLGPPPRSKKAFAKSSVREIPNSSNEASSDGIGSAIVISSDEESGSSSNEAEASDDDVASETHRAIGTRLGCAGGNALPEAVAAAGQFAQDFALDPHAVPSVLDARLVFRTSAHDGRSMRTRKTAPSNVYRVGRDVLGEMR
jgi:hypothetical protein